MAKTDEPIPRDTYSIRHKSLTNFQLTFSTLIRLSKDCEVADRGFLEFGKYFIFRKIIFSKILHFFQVFHATGHPAVV